MIFNMKSRIKGDFHVRFCGNAGVKFPCMTRLAASGGQRCEKDERLEKKVQFENLVSLWRQRKK